VVSNILSHTSTKNRNAKEAEQSTYNKKNNHFNTFFIKRLFFDFSYFFSQKKQIPQTSPLKG